MVPAISYSILGAIVISAGIFIFKSFSDACDHIVDDWADDPHPASLLATVSSFHDRGL